MLQSEGRFRAHAVSCALTLAGNGREQLAVAFEVLDGPEKGQRITWYGFLTPAALKRTFESLRFAGWTGADLSDLSGVGSRDCEIVVAAEEWGGRPQLKVRWVNPQGGFGAPAAPLPADRLKALVEATRQAAQASRKVLVGQPEPPAHTDADAPGEEDIPF